MKCPQCSGDFETINLRTISGGLLSTRRCVQCGGFWFAREIGEQFIKDSVEAVDVPILNYSLRNLDLICPNDKTLLAQMDDAIAEKVNYWSCEDCGGMFFPRGQLALYVAHREKLYGSEKPGNIGRAQAAGAISLVFLLIVIVGGSLNKIQYTATADQVLPTSGPNLMTLVILALAYLAGTVLAILSRRVSLLLVGWSVILLSLFGFALIIFGP